MYPVAPVIKIFIIMIFSVTCYLSGIDLLRSVMGARYKIYFTFLIQWWRCTWCDAPPPASIHHLYRNIHCNYHQEILSYNDDRRFFEYRAAAENYLSRLSGYSKALLHKC